MSFHWLSDNIGRFKIEVGLAKNKQKCNTISDDLASSQQQAVMQGEVIMLYCHSDNSHVSG